MPMTLAQFREMQLRTLHLAKAIEAYDNFVAQLEPEQKYHIRHQIEVYVDDTATALEYLRNIQTSVGRILGVIPQLKLRIRHGTDDGEGE